MTRLYFSTDLFETWSICQGAKRDDLTRILDYWKQYEGKPIEVVRREETIALREWFTTKEDK